MKKLARSLRIVAAVIVIGGIAAVAFWPASIEVDLVTVSRGPMQVTIDEEGETRVRDRFVVSAPVTGRLLRIELEPGDRASKGAVVARLLPVEAPLLDPRARAEFTAAIEASRAALAQATAERERAAATLALARDVLKRREQLVAAGLVSREEQETARTDVDTAMAAGRAADAAVSQARYQVALAQARLQSPSSTGRAIDLKSPVDGVVLKRVRESEAVVQAGEPLVEIGNPGQIEVVADLLSTDAVRVKPGDAVNIEQWGGGQTLTGRVRLVEPSGFMKVSALGVEEQRVNIIIDFVDAAAARALGDGYRVEVNVVTWQADDVVMVPVGSLFRRGDAWAVFVVDGNRARLRTIELGRRNDTSGEIVRGLQSGDVVVLHPPDILSDGMRIRRRVDR